jgi:hypothetical protein
MPDAAEQADPEDPGARAWEEGLAEGQRYLDAMQYTGSSKADPLGLKKMSIQELRWWLASNEPQLGNPYNWSKARAALNNKLDQRAHRLKWGTIISGGLVGAAAILQAIVQLVI